MDKETYFLQLLQQSGVTYQITDDCAWLSPLLYNQKQNGIKNTKSYIIAADSFIENIHFRIQHTTYNIQQHIAYKAIKRYTYPNQWLSYENTAKKAFLVNISDILSSGALPKYALLAIVLPKTLQKEQIKAIVSGITQICQTHRIQLIGGDTMCGNELAFHITIIGDLIGHYLHRNAIRNGDLLAYTSMRKGDLGNSLKTLRILLRYGAQINTIPHNCIESANIYSRFALPFLRIQFLKKSHRLLHACMDISDGLANEIKRLESQNKLAFTPLSNLQKRVYQSGEEYELLFSFPPKHLHALQKIAHTTRTRLHVVGKFGRYKPHFFHIIKWHT